MQTEQAKKMIDTQLERLGEALQQGKSEQLKEFLATMARFHNYSLGNTLLIMVQRPEATQVAGFHTWRQLGRTVKKGEKGIAILAPMRLRPRGDEQGAEEADDDREERPVRFRVVYVFDVEQTEGEALPEFARPQGDPGDYLERLRALVSDLDIELQYRDDLGGAQGVSAGGLIAIKSGLTPAEEFSTLVHELAHERLHRGEGRTGTTKRGRELEAEAVAYVVSQGVGLECGTASSDYIHLYRGDREALSASLERIREASRAILASLYKDHSKAREAPPPSAASYLREEDAAQRGGLDQPGLFD